MINKFISFLYVDIIGVNIDFDKTEDLITISKQNEDFYYICNGDRKNITNDYSSFIEDLKYLQQKAENPLKFAKQ